MKNFYLTILGLVVSLALTAQTTATISQIQGQAAASPFVGDSVITSGVVTALVKNNDGTDKGYYIQDGAGAWNGIYVFDYNNVPSVGDNITIQAEVSEYNNMTELDYVSSFTVNSSGNTLPAATILTPAQASTEDYEAVLVKVNGVNCVTSPDNYGVWYGLNNGDTLKVDDQILKTSVFTPVVSATYDVTGIMNFDWGYFKIEPRSTSDVVISAGVLENLLNNTKIYPVPANNMLNISSEQKIVSTELFNIVGSKINSTLVNSNNAAVNVSEYAAGIYMLKVNFENNSLIQKVIIK